MRIVVLGGGAAGFFAALAAKEAAPEAEVILIEKSAKVLSKVRISGGGRCNVTHSCFDPKRLVEHYPRGHKELLGPFHRFQPRDTIAWFESRGVPLKTEEDGRIFPCSDRSESIIDCLMKELVNQDITLRLQTKIERILSKEGTFILETSVADSLVADRLILATGSSKEGYLLAEQLGHKIEPLLPSLFTFTLPHSNITSLAGVSVEEVRLSLRGSSFAQQGPLLITHWGLSGPAVLKLSAFAAPFLAEKGYHADLVIDWLPTYSVESLIKKLEEWIPYHANKQMATLCPFSLSKSLWRHLLTEGGIVAERLWRTLQKDEMRKFAKRLKEDLYQMKGKATHKEEFVTCGGIRLSEVNFKRMESRLCPHLFFCGELLDIDGVTGGFNFQNAWTTGWIAGQGAVEK